MDYKSIFSNELENDIKISKTSELSIENILLNELLTENDNKILNTTQAERSGLFLNKVFYSAIDLYKKESSYIYLASLWSLFACLFFSSRLIFVYLKEGLGVNNAALLVCISDLLSAYVAYSASHKIFPKFYKEKPDAGIRVFEVFSFITCVIITSLYYLNVYTLGSQSEDAIMIYSQLSYIFPLQTFLSVLVQQCGTIGYLLDVNIDRFGEKTGSYLTILIFGCAHFLCVFYTIWDIAVILVPFSIVGTVIWIKLRVKFNSVLLPFFLHYLFHMSFIYAFSLKILLSSTT